MNTPTTGHDDAPVNRRVPTMLDVARLAGVSQMTVSRVLNSKSFVRERTRKKVIEAAAALNYSPNHEARILAGGKPIRVGFLYSMPGEHSSGYLTQVLFGMLNDVSLNNVQLSFRKSDSDGKLLEQARRFLDGGIDGIILPPPLGDNLALVDLVATAGIPAVVIACGQPDPGIGSIGIDERGAAYRMSRHLIELGHRRIGFITGHPKQSGTAPRLAGYQDAVREFGTDTGPELVAEGMFDYRSGLDAAEVLLALPERPSAIFASNDDMAAATVAVAHRLGLDVPGDITVAGFDDTFIASTIWPALTTVRQPTMEMAGAALQSVVRRIHALRAGEPAPAEHAIVDATLVRRQSDAAPRVRPPARLTA